MCCWVPPQSGGGPGINVAAWSPQSIPASVPSFASFAETLSSPAPTAVATPAASNAGGLIEPSTLGALISMQAAPQSTDSLVLSGPMADAAPSPTSAPPPDPPKVAELPVGVADGAAPVAVISSSTTDVSGSSAPVAAGSSSAGAAVNPRIDQLAAADGATDLSQRIDGLWLKLLES